MGSVLLISLVFCVVVFGGFRVTHLFSFLCCVFWWVPCYSSFWFSVLWFLVGSVLLIFLVFCVVVFDGFRVAHLFSFLCCVFWWVLCSSSF
jgi:hypothetical protein